VPTKSSVLHTTNHVQSQTSPRCYSNESRGTTEGESVTSFNGGNDGRTCTADGHYYYSCTTSCSNHILYALLKVSKWWGAGVVICLARCADLHMAQLMALSLASVKFRLVLPFWYRLTWVVPDKGPLNGCVCVCV